MSLDMIQKGVKDLRDRVSFRKGERERIRTTIDKLRDDRGRVEAQQQQMKEAILLLEHAGQGAREMICKRIDNIVTFALQSVFGEDYKFATTLEIKRNAPWVDFHVISSEYEEAADPLDSRGGGVVDIISLALRIVFLELHQPFIDGPLLLDEPTKQLSKEYSGRAAELLSAFAERTGRQIILVTHDPVLAKEAETKVEL